MAIQVAGALLDLCVLAVVSRGDTYGYALTQRVRGSFGVAESSVYPVLRRLQQDSFLVTYDQPYDGRNRRYYSITKAGRLRLTELIAEWNGFRNELDRLVGEEDMR